MSASTLPIDVIRALNVGKQSRLGALALLAYDHFLTLDTEVNYVWSQRWSFGKYLYFFNRWLSLVWLVFDSVPLAPSGIVSSKVCIIYLMMDDIITLTATLSVQIILQLRVYAIYERSRKMLIFLLVMVTLEVSIMAVLIGITISRIAGLPVISTKTGCSYSGLLPVSSLFWVPALIFEPVLCFLVLARTWKDLPRGIIFGRAPNLPAVLARDSILYFILVFINLLAATIIFANFPHFINVINPWASAIPSLLGSRLLLNMRERMLQTEVMTNKELGLPSGTEDSVATLVAGSNPRHSHYRNQSRSYGVSTDIGSVEMKSFVEMQSPDARYDYTPRR